MKKSNLKIKYSICGSTFSIKGVNFTIQKGKSKIEIDSFEISQLLKELKRYAKTGCTIQTLAINSEEIELITTKLKEYQDKGAAHYLVSKGFSGEL